MSKPTAAVAGAGIAGLAAAAALAQRGFAVRIFERTEDPREFGAGLYPKENSLPVLDRLGAGEAIAASGVRIRSVRIADERGRIIVKRSTEDERLIVVKRGVLHAALRDAALRAGAELVTGTTVTGARPDGTLLIDGDAPVRADLVIAADGRGSLIRESLGLTRVNKTLGSGATRLLIPREERDLVSTEYWAGSRRVGVVPCSADETYLFIIGPETDPRATRVPLDREYWTTALPRLASVFARIPDDAGVHHAHAYVNCRSWTAGRVAIIGDAAHAQPPNLGQGAGLAIALADQLADLVGAGGDIPAALKTWEHRVRFKANMVQRITTAYDLLGNHTPEPLLPLRARTFHGLSTFKPTANQWEFYWRGGVNAPPASSSASASASAEAAG
jgi:2-polyprenyl-6-methoxyphenol hydroxylase-like FAD-dependent oxidoreductase